MVGNPSTTSEPNYIRIVTLHNQSYTYFEHTFFDFSQIRTCPGTSLVLISHADTLKTATMTKIARGM